MATKKKQTTKAKGAVPTIGAVEAGIPIPQVAQGNSKYPVEELKPGDSFLVTCTPDKAKATKANIMGAARRVAKKTGREFVVLVRPEEKGVRCWRSDDGSVDLRKEGAPAPAPQVVEEAPEQADDGWGDVEETPVPTAPLVPPAQGEAPQVNVFAD